MRLIEISAWNDSGGGFLHRLFDGHPGLNVWPFELLLGNNDHAPDRLSPEWFRGRFRWPRLEGLTPENGAALFDQVSDSELKPVLLEPHLSRHSGFNVSVALAVWRDTVVQQWAEEKRHDQSRFLEIYIETFFALADPHGADRPVLGHCPTIVLDAEEFWADFPDARMIHVIRSPWAGFADMSRRHPGLSALDYAKKWSLINGLAGIYAAKHPDRFRLVSLDMLLNSRQATTDALCDWLAIARSETMSVPTWNGRRLDPENMGPFGGVPAVSRGRDLELHAGLDPVQAQTIAQVTAGTRVLLNEISDEKIAFSTVI